MEINLLELRNYFLFYNMPLDFGERAHLEKSVDEVRVLASTMLQTSEEPQTVDLLEGGEFIVPAGTKLVEINWNQDES